MFSYLDTFRKKPVEERRKASIYITLVVLGVVLILWVLLGAVRTYLFPIPQEVAPKELGGILTPYQE